jgi:hypothetical protein
VTDLQVAPEVRIGLAPEIEVVKRGGPGPLGGAASLAFTAAVTEVGCADRAGGVEGLAELRPPCGHKSANPLGVRAPTGGLST